MAPSIRFVAALLRLADANLDEASMLQMPAVEKNLEKDASDCACPGYYEEQCRASAFQGCVWTDAGDSNAPWCQCDQNFQGAPPLFGSPPAPATAPPGSGPPVPDDWYVQRQVPDDWHVERQVADVPAYGASPAPPARSGPPTEHERQVPDDWYVERQEVPDEVRTPDESPAYGASPAPPALPPNTLSQPATCPVGWDQRGEAGADIGGCGLQSCEDRYTTTSEVSCGANCDDMADCIGFSYAPVNGDRNHESTTVCTLYNSASPTGTWTGSAGAVQVFCVRPTPPPPISGPAVCPIGWNQVGEAGADIGGCGLQTCGDRYTATSEASCAESCDAHADCVGFSYAPVGGDRNHESTSVCTLYNSDSPTGTWTGSAGAIQVFCTRTSTCPPSMEVLSNEHFFRGVQYEPGRYFNFDVASAAQSLGRPLRSGENLWAWSEQAGMWRLVKVWTSSQGASVGDGSGRRHPYADTAPGDWEVGDHITLAAFQGFDVLSVEHAHGPEAFGKYFNFDVASAQEHLGRPMVSGEVLWARSERHAEWSQVKVWTASNGGSVGDGHGRKHPFTEAATGDWEVGDHLFFAGEPTVLVSSVNSQNQPDGQYFNFDQADAPFALQSTKYWALSERTGAAMVKVWAGSTNGGTTGDSFGRLDSGSAPGDWEVGDLLTLEHQSRSANAPNLQC